MNSILAKIELNSVKRKFDSNLIKLAELAMFALLPLPLLLALPLLEAP